MALWAPPVFTETRKFRWNDKTGLAAVRSTRPTKHRPPELFTPRRLFAYLPPSDFKRKSPIRIGLPIDPDFVVRHAKLVKRQRIWYNEKRFQ
jgi:hypothetical protein